MKLIARISLVMGLLLAAGPARGQDQVPWAADFKQACEFAARHQRLVLLHFYADDCEPCVRVEQNVFSRPEVAQAIARNYVPVKVHAGRSPDLAARYQVTRWPTDVAVTPAGLEVHRSTSPQVPELYIELVDLMALKAGVGTSRQWAANMQQVGQATLDQAAASTQNVAQGVQQQWGQTAQQFQDAAGQARGSALQMSQQAQDAARQYGQQAQGVAQQFQQQANQQVQATAQQTQQQIQSAGQQVQNSAQQYGDAARSTVNQFQTSLSSNDLRAPFPAGPPADNRPPPPAPATQNPWLNGPQLAPPHAPPNYAAAPYAAPPQQPGSPAGVQFAAQQPAAPQQSAQFVPASQAPPLALEGYCAVTLLESMKWRKADPQFGAVHRGRTFLFANADQQRKFLANPDGYAPVLSGCDPVRFAGTGEMVEGKRAYGLLTEDKRIFLFADEASLNLFTQSPQRYAQNAYQAMLRSETVPTYR